MAHDFKVLSSELLLDAPIVAVRQDKLAMPNDQVAFREVVEHMGAVAVRTMKLRWSISTDTASSAACGRFPPGFWTSRASPKFLVPNANW